MKAKYILAVLCGMIFSEVFVSAQMEEFRFKLYLESLSSGKKDTLELGIGSNGMVGCDYDSTLCTVYTDPFFDTVDHIGAFVVDDKNGCNHWDAYYNWYLEEGDTIRIECPMYIKKRIGKVNEDMVIVFPLAELPIMFSWDQSLFQDTLQSLHPIFTNWCSGRRPDVGQGHKWRAVGVWDMSEVSFYELEAYENPGERGDSITFLTFIQDISGQEHPYMHMFIGLVTTEMLSISQNGEVESFVKLFPNPAKDRFVWKSGIPIKHWQVFSQNGRAILEGSGQQNEIDCSFWASGLYVFCWEDYLGNSGCDKLIKIN